MKIVMMAAAGLAVLTPGLALAQSGKPTVGVVRIDDLTRSNQADTLSAMIESAIAGTGKFRMIERQQVAAVQGDGQS